ncbi:Ferrochelatase, protoheme ferro-lyase [Mycolicibacterium fortuitum]|uniref:Coproporphyrin III ferrochelatase n=3 Tax=Mycolicibacterium fortuitum TaxID=1766 RepID=A0A0N9Y6E0_MYCFO|nr:ferrochelatase [Mycolicibacterium fortuitum]AIY46551.1 Ferrochelatase, protoheme ferro-lyase [Mycobacterium sp. VKM Ac-1817D]CRL69708.1 ferrochelatase [Mycolicibacter nonchromogenicus]BDD98797.1 ferrochelatase [Mycolicibacterium fortuitum subsp. fortuitum]ALI26796.1 Ferrochelatase, protoheme ferro-lyase [Mycolicibacterium fortuitum]EJZ15703.1 ferrochelatase [Mycolicibacterium fortuitum subsp. fortuitum DSM 46621 = ATCC 6841 = JCM 6387]
MNEFDAVLLLSFGGPEGPEQVMPFLENVTRGRGIPAERLAEVAEHYLHFGGVSPINGINRALIEQLRLQLPDLPVYFGNRNWEPYVEDTVAEMRDNGIRRAAVFTTSAWGGYSSCAQYVEDIVRARTAAGPDAPELVKLRQYFDHPLLVEMFADSIAAAAETLPAELRDEARLVFTAHSVPIAADERHGPRIYSRQVAYATRLVAAAAGYDDYDQVWQSRSGPPRIPWLEPDVADHLATLGQKGTRAVIVCPIGFVADHIEVVWDLDHELRLQAEAAGIAFARAGTPNADPRFARLAAGLIEELRTGTEPLRVAGPDPVAGYGCSVNGAPCAPDCCITRS